MVARKATHSGNNDDSLHQDIMIDCGEPMDTEFILTTDVPAWSFLPSGHTHPTSNPAANEYLS